MSISPRVSRWRDQFPVSCPNTCASTIHVSECRCTCSRVRTKGRGDSGSRWYPLCISGELTLLSDSYAGCRRKCSCPKAPTLGRSCKIIHVHHTDEKLTADTGTCWRIGLVRLCRDPYLNPHRTILESSVLITEPTCQIKAVDRKRIRRSEVYRVSSKIQGV